MGSAHAEQPHPRDLKSTDKTMARNSTALVQTFEKGLQLLEYLVEHKVVSVTSIAKLMGI